MRLTFLEQLDEARRAGTWRAEAALWARAAWDLVAFAPKEHCSLVIQDLRHAFRTMAAKPAFPSFAVLSLTLAIGATTAIFSLWNNVLNAPLPGVDRPGELIMLSNPSAQGMWRGTWSTRADGPRSWVSYAEFEQLREHASAFSSLMASQSSLNGWQARVEGGPVEEARGRLVSGGFFQVLGVRPALGRLFAATEDTGEPAYAVISHSYWQRRFGGRPDALGKTLTIHGTSISIVGVAAAGFVGENGGQQPDLWLPLRLQPRVLPGSDWLHEEPPDKAMWLHVFGRLKPGVAGVQAESQANAIFRAGLESFYGARGDQWTRELLDQELQLRPGGRGVSATLEQFSSSLSALFASVGILLLIACANLANLLTARGAARRPEISVRLSLGASRGRLVRQLVTESLALAALGGIAALALAFVLHGVLVRRLQEGEPWFFVEFSFSLPVLSFAVAATFATALAFGVLPAWQTTKSGGGPSFKNTSRTALGSKPELRLGRWLVALQLALSLPLLVGAGLLSRTVYNLQRPNLGFRAERLMLTRVSLNDLAQDVTRRDRVLRELRAGLERIPGVDGATFSQLGLFSGGVSTSGIEVEGSALTERGEQYSALDRVGPHYFTTLGVPIRLGRDISDDDRADTPFVCLVNEAFVKRYFGGRHPIGLHVATIGDAGVRTAYQVVGVVGNARTHALRGEVEPRFFVPAEQRSSSSGSRTFLIQSGTDKASTMRAVREAIAEADSSLAIAEMSSIEEKLAELTAEDRTIAWLALMFGGVALALAAIGLYGVLSLGIARRTSEIGLRIALGAQSRDVIGMILRETGGAVLTGVALGGALTVFGSRLITSRLYGVAPHDPLTLTLAIGVLLMVAFVATYLPASRASGVDPVAALNEG